MTTKTSHPFLRRAALSLCLLGLSLVVLTVTARAENPPKFKDPEVTAWFQKMSDLFDALIKAAKAKDSAKLDELNGKVAALMKEAEPLQTKVTPEEDKAADKWMAEEGQKLQDATK